MSAKPEHAKTLLMIKAHANSLLPVEQYMRSKGWKLVSTNQLREALTTMFSDRPSFVMISVNHPSRKLKTLPEIIMQILPDTFIIPFSEEKTAASFAALSAQRDRFVIFPPVSGASVERTFARLTQDRKRKSGAKAFPLEKMTDAEKTEMLESAKEISAQLGVVQVPVSVGNGGLEVKGVESKTQSLIDEMIREPDDAKDEVSGVVNVVGGTAKGASSAAADKIVIEGDRSRAPASDALIADITGAEEDNEIGVKTRSICIELETPTFFGYLISAMGRNCNIEEEFFARVRELLIGFLIDQGEVPDISEDTLKLKVRSLPYEDWAIASSRILRDLVHNDNQAAITLFSEKDLYSLFGESPDDDMVSISLTQIKGDTVVECNLYVYLPANKKYLLYKRKGSTFYKNQKENLQAKGITELHVAKDEQKDFLRYHSQNLAKNKVETFAVGGPAADLKKIKTS